MSSETHIRFGIILAGGSGERFWPVSRKDRPKQLLCLTHPDQTMLHEAVTKLSGLLPADRIFVITGSHLVEAIGAAKIGLAASNIIAEPDKRNTAGAILYVTAAILARHPEVDPASASFAIVTADHAIGEPALFCETLDTALSEAEKQQALATCGIVPTHPETGFGYIQRGDGAEEKGKIPCYTVKAFHEKPVLDKARAYLESEEYFWNSGMFFWPYSAFLRELRQADEALGATYDKLAAALAAKDGDGATKAFQELPSVSIDVALMEKAKKVLVVPGTFPWSDIGSWPALESVQEPDSDGNCTLGDPTLIDARNCVVYNEPGASKMAVGVLGVDDLAVIVTKDAVLVIPKDRAQDVKAIVQRLKDTNAPQL